MASEDWTLERVEYNKRGFKWAPPGSPPDVLDQIPDFTLTSEDVVVATYPKAGTTWMQEIMYLIHNGCDLEEAKKAPIYERVMHMEFSAPGLELLEVLRKKPSPRIMKTHLPYQFFEKQVCEQKAKFVVVMRNPKDNLVSYFHFHKTVPAYCNYSGTWDDFYKMYMEEKVISGDMIDYNLSWWNNRHHDNVLIVTYEDMKRDLRDVIAKVATFCGKDLGDDVLDRITMATTFDSMKKNPATNHDDAPFVRKDISPFMRKGEVSDWKNYFSEEQGKHMDERVKAKTEGTGLEFQYEI